MKFRVGQRVRVLFLYNAHLYGSECLGKEGTVIAERELAPPWFSGYTIRVDGCQLLRSDGSPTTFTADQLAPAYDGAQPIAWDWRAWMENPQGVEV